MGRIDFNTLQKQLVVCQDVLDQARQQGWTPELVESFDQASKSLAEFSILNKHNAWTATDDSSPSFATQESQEEQETPTNTLLPPEEEYSSTQVDLLSSIGELTLAEKLALQPLSEVSEGLSILDRAQFTSVLFSGEEHVFGTLLSKLARASTQEEAFAMFQEALCPRGEEEEIETLKADFAKRIMRTFVS